MDHESSGNVIIASPWWDYADDLANYIADYRRAFLHREFVPFAGIGCLNRASSCLDAIENQCGRPRFEMQETINPEIGRPFERAYKAAFLITDAGGILYEAAHIASILEREHGVALTTLVTVLREAADEAREAGTPTCRLSARWLSVHNLKSFFAHLWVAVVGHPVVAQTDPPQRRGGMSPGEANAVARRLLDKDESFRTKSSREWANAIGCSQAQVVKLPVWKAIMEESGRARPTGGAARPGVISLTHKVLAGASQDQGNEELNRLIEEQNADYEPSPLDDDPHPHPTEVRERKRL